MNNNGAGGSYCFRTDSRRPVPRLFFMKNCRDTSGELRNHFDSNSTFMTGHRIIKTRQHKRRIPDWAKSDIEIRKMIERSFPYVKTNNDHYRRAARWALFINLYFKMNKTRSEIMDEMGLSYQAVDSLCRAVYRAGKGIKSNGKGPTAVNCDGVDSSINKAGGKPGRPKK